MRIRAAVLHEPRQPIAIDDVELDAPKDDEVLVRVAAAGVCHSDVRLADGELGDGRWPMVLGHEGAGIVEAAGSQVTHVSPGDPVGFCIVPSCRDCEECRAGRLNLCIPAGENGPRGVLMDGTSRLSLPDGAPLPHTLPLWQASLLGCGVVTGFGAVRNAAGVRPGESAAVIGCGGVGMQVITALRLAGATPIVAVDTDQAKLALALARGATHVVDPDSTTTVSRVVELTGRGVDHAFEVVGLPETMRLAWDVLRPGGTAVVVGLAARGVEVSLPAIDFLSDKGIRGSYYGNRDPMVDMPELAQLALSGDLDLAGVVTHIEPLEAVNEALDRLRNGSEGVRTVLVIDADLAGYP